MKWIVLQKEEKENLSSFTHPHVVPNLYEFLQQNTSSVGEVTFERMCYSIALLPKKVTNCIVSFYGK